MTSTDEAVTFRQMGVQFRQYVVTGEWATPDNMFATCYHDRMAKAVEYASYTGDGEDTDRYFTMIDGNMVEVVFRCAPSGTYTDGDDYMHSTWGVFVKGDEDGEPIDTFHVRIDGRA